MFPIFLVLVAAFGLGIWLLQQNDTVGSSDLSAPEIQGSFYPQAKPVADFLLQDSGGKAFTHEDLRGRWSILFFGFTSCPHICPANMTQLTRVYADLQEQNPEVVLPQVVFVSVDPQTDDQNRLKDFIAHFDASFHAIGGSDAQLAPLEQSLNITHSAGMPKASGFYFVDHSNLLNLVDPEGRVVADFAPPFTQEGLRQNYINAIRYLNDKS
jgi:protein SCO1/2